jgi:hypothetical protein
MIVLKIVIALWAIISLFVYISQIITLPMVPTVTSEILFKVRGYMLSAGQITLATTFFYYGEYLSTTTLSLSPIITISIKGGAFYLQRRVYKISTKTRKALGKVCR